MLCVVSYENEEVFLNVYGLHFNIESKFSTLCKNMPIVQKRKKYLFGQKICIFPNFCPKKTFFFLGGKIEKSVIENFFSKDFRDLENIMFLLQNTFLVFGTDCDDLEPDISEDIHIYKFCHFLLRWALPSTTFRVFHTSAVVIKV